MRMVLKWVRRRIGKRLGGGSGRVKRKGTVTIAIIPQCFLEVGEVPPLVSPCNGTHAFYVPHIRVFQGDFDGEEGKNEHTKFNITLHNNMYFNAPNAPSFAFPSCASPPDPNPTLPSMPSTPCVLKSNKLSCNLHLRRVGFPIGGPGKLGGWVGSRWSWWRCGRRSV